MRRGEAGVTLVNVLVVLAITSGLVVLLLRQQEDGQDIVARHAALAQAEQIALGAEASVLAALRRDLDTGPEEDHFAEPWAGVIQEEVALPEGRFSVKVRDRQAKFDINLLTAPAVGPQTLFQRLATRLDIDAAEARRIAELVALLGAVRDLSDLEARGIAPDTLARLAPHVTALPVPSTINLNTADPLLMEVLFQNPGIASQLLFRRRSQGFVSRKMLTDLGALRPGLTGFGSHAWEVEILAESGAARVRLLSLIQRRNDLEGKAVALISRRFDAPLPTEAPAEP
ncbi:general secretion pathway protein GspK [Marinovum algicola]|jgi:general secretion pathway protein K|uniref:general secretion pathway protein GspK n=1 Tax=Marinovum algicola TaxID=42444 RepID=UPI00065B2675|nr:type II secretion system protein GspK [Marinovum algicola]AKO99075.1 Type II secretory pathway, component PulK [Marinovum algicola DG 898]